MKESTGVMVHQHHSKDSSRLYLHFGVRSSDCSMRAGIAVRTAPPHCQVPCWGSRYSMSLKLFTVASSLFGHFLCDSCSYSGSPVDKSPLLISTLLTLQSWPQNNPPPPPQTSPCTSPHTHSPHDIMLTTSQL